MAGSPLDQKTHVGHVCFTHTSHLPAGSETSLFLPTSLSYDAFWFHLSLVFYLFPLLWDDFHTNAAAPLHPLFPAVRLPESTCSLPHCAPGHGPLFLLVSWHMDHFFLYIFMSNLHHKSKCIFMLSPDQLLHLRPKSCSWYLRWKEWMVQPQPTGTSLQGLGSLLQDYSY